MQNYYIWTIGCQMNKADSDRLGNALGQMGLSETAAAKDADVVVLNSCVVRQSAEDKVVGLLNSLRSFKKQDQNRVIALMGCMVGPKTIALENQFPHVDVFMRPQQYQPLLQVLGERMGVDPDGCIGPLTASETVTAYVPIIHGCDKFCSFCIIPYRRGREVSRTIQDIVKEIRLLSNRGVKEITLLGQNVDSYGHDLPGSTDLGNLLEAVNEERGIERIRFLTSHPNDMSDHIIEAAATLEKVCEHINLPFQAGDDEVLNRMRRGYTNIEYRKLVDKIRNKIPNVSMSTDLIVGFCGETEDQFNNTLKMLREIRFDKVHSSAYSPRDGTISARKLDDDVPYAEKKDRLKAVEELQSGIQAEINSALQGRTLEILVEGIRKGRTEGRNRNDKLVYTENGHDKTGKLVNVKIHSTTPWSLQGTQVEAA